MHKYAPLLTLFITLAALPVSAAEGDGDATTGPRIYPASNEGEAAISKMQAAPGLKIELFAAEPLLANPVSLRVDDKGRIFVVEAFRRIRGQVEIRSHLDWAEEDLGLKNVNERIAMLKRKFGPNVRGLRDYSDVVQLLEDTKNTGHADKSSVFADGFNSIEAGTAAGILPTPDGVYFADIPSIYRLRDFAGSGKATERDVISTGYGVHISYRGHDLHGLRRGPDGKIYFSIGDRGLSVQTEHGLVDNIDSGAVLRCNPDGTDLEVFATGLRNPEQLLFDQYGNLFTGDNNPDYGDPARWVYVVEGGDSGWRIFYQLSRKPVPGGQWMAEYLYELPGKLRADYILPPIAHLGAGPSGVAYYPGTGLSDHWNEHMFMCDFRGSPAGSLIHSFKMKPRGAGFELVDYEKFLQNCLATDIDFSTVGGAYVCDWVNGWGSPGKGRIYRIFDPAAAQSPVVEQTRKLLADGIAERPADELASLLAHPDIRVRQEAQFALAAGGAASIPKLSAVIANSSAQLARIHAIWGLGQIAAQDPQAALKPLLPLLADKDDEIRAQAAKVLGDNRAPAAFDGFIKLLDDPSLRVRFFAAQGLGHLRRREAVAPLLAMVRENDNRDPWLRHAAVMGLCGSGDVDAVLSAAADSSSAVRVAVLLTLRRLQRAEVAQFLNDADDGLVLEAARAIYDVPIPEALPKLAAIPVKRGLAEPVAARIISANFRTGQPESAKRLAAIASDQELPAEWRVEALRDLGLWENPPPLDVLLHASRPLAPRDAAVARTAIEPVLPVLFETAPDPVRVAAVALFEKLKIDNPLVLNTLATGERFAPAVRQEALTAMSHHPDAQLAAAVNLAMAAKNEPLRCAAIRCLALLPAGVNQLKALVETGSTAERQAAFAALAELPDGSGDEALLAWADKLVAGQVAPELRLDVLEAAAKRGTPALAARVKQYESAQSKSDPLAAYRDALTGGTAENGRQIFRERADVSCIRCHNAEGMGGIVGPKLDAIGKRQTREYLLESIVYPNAKIAPGYESAAVKLSDGSTAVGVVKKETASDLMLMSSDGKTIKVLKKNIMSRERGLSAMPEGLAAILSRRELRDVVEYLAGLR